MRDTIIDGGDFNLILLAEHKLGLPPLFYFKLADIKDDWAFILKLHALFEGVVHRLLVQKASQFEFTEPLLSEGDSFYKKVETAARFFLLPKDDEEHVPVAQYLLALNQLRNLITHDLKFIDLDLQRYVASLSEVQFQKAARSLAISFQDRPPDDQSSAPLRRIISGWLKLKPPKHRITTVREFFLNYSAKPAIWSGGGPVLTALSVSLHIQPVGDSLGTDPLAPATLQDLLLDPQVIEYKRQLSQDMGVDL